MGAASEQKTSRSRSPQNAQPLHEPEVQVAEQIAQTIFDYYIAPRNIEEII